MDYEQELIVKVLAEKDILPAVDSKITKDFFYDELNAKVWTFTENHWREHGATPAWKTVKEHFPEFGPAKPVRPPEPTSYYVEALREAHVQATLTTAFAMAFQEVKKHKDPKEAITLAMQGINKAEADTTTLTDLILNDTWDERIAQYKERRDNPGLLGIPTGFPTIDKATMGLQPEQLATLVGLPKSGKSTFLIRIAISVQDYGKKVLFLSFEMSNQEQAARHDSMQAHVAQRRLLDGSLTHKDIDALVQAGKDKGGLPDFVLAADAAGATTVNGIAARIERVKPDVCFVDGAYLLDDQEGEAKGSPQALTNITRGLKRLAQKSKIPIIISTQVLPSKMKKKDGITQDAIGYSSSFAQDSDVILGAEADVEDENVVTLRVVIARNAPRVHTRVRWDWDHGTFEEIEEAQYDEDAED